MLAVAFLSAPWRELAIAGLAAVSLRLTPREIRRDNGFSAGPMVEVAVLFAGIFLTMIPALELLHLRGHELGVRAPWQFFWATGLLSSFLDNAPTYLTFLALGQSLKLPAEVVGVPDAILIATGSSWPQLAQFPVDGKTIITSKQALDLESAPPRMIILGAGVEGCECASLFSGLGTQVTMIQRGPHILSECDEDLARPLSRRAVLEEPEGRLEVALSRLALHDLLLQRADARLGPFSLLQLLLRHQLPDGLAGGVLFAAQRVQANFERSKLGVEAQKLVDRRGDAAGAA